MAIYQFTRGDTFVFSSTLKLSGPTGPIADLTGWTGRSQIRTPKLVLISTLNFEWLNAALRSYKVSAPDDTSVWPIGEALISIELTSPDETIVVSTKPAKFLIISDITQ